MDFQRLLTGVAVLSTLTINGEPAPSVHTVRQEQLPGSQVGV